MDFKVVEINKKSKSKFRTPTKGKIIKPDAKLFIEHFGNNVYGVKINNEIHYIKNDTIEETNPIDGKFTLYPSMMNDKYNKVKRKGFTPNKVKHHLQLDAYLRKTEKQRIIVNAYWKPFYTGQRILRYKLGVEPNTIIITKLSKR